MKRNQLLLCAIAAGSLLLGSCTGGADPTTASYGTTLVNVVENTTDGSTKLSYGAYEFVYNITDGVVQLTASNVKCGNNQYSFKSSDMKYQEVTLTNGSVTRFSASDMPGSNSSVSATNLSAEITTLYSYNPLQGYITNLWRHYAITYNVNDYSVRTIEQDSFYSGTTNTSYVYQDQHKEFSTTDITYEIRLDVENNSADLYIYNAKFAEEQPYAISQMKLGGLTLVAENGSYTLTGTNIIPDVYESNAYTPNPKYVFNTISFRFTNEALTQGTLSFTCAGAYQASATLAYTL